VRIGGKLATSGVVVIEDARGRSAAGSIKKDGTYTVVGPPKGACKVMLRRSPPLDESVSATPDPKQPAGEPPFPIPAKYASAKATDIEVTVTNSAQIFDIERDDKLDFSPPSSGLPGGTAGGKGLAPGAAKPPGSSKPAGPGMPSGSGGPGMPKK